MGKERIINGWDIIMRYVALILCSVITGLYLGGWWYMHHQKTVEGSMIVTIHQEPSPPLTPSDIQARVIDSED